MAKQKLSPKGFTIIETLIVLAVAGLILSFVLIAIPTLQRSSRNNQRRQDVQAVLEAVSHYELNHSGSIPSDNSYLQYAKLTYYDHSGVSMHGLTPGGSASPQTDLDQINIYNYQKCNGGSPTSQGAGYNDVVALYALESGSNATPKCQEL